MEEPMERQRGEVSVEEKEERVLSEKEGDFRKSVQDYFSFISNSIHT